ncbi:hypothetical protein KA062_02300 [Patescibacteria group bacterium]|nr:hypothetical protein [Patescibacteria group bacterium]
MKTIDTPFKLWVHLDMSKRSIFPAILIFVVFMVVPVAFWIISTNKNSEDVKGAKTGISGAVIKIISKNGSWDMYKYLCKDSTECLESVSSGKMVEKTSGGGVEDQFVNLGYSSDWANYEFLKIYVEPGWGSIERLFSATKSDGFDNVAVRNIENNGKNYQVILIPTNILEQTDVEIVSFSDN